MTMAAARAMRPDCPPRLTPPVYVADEEAPTYSATLRLVTDGDLDAYTGFGSGFSWGSAVIRW